MFLRTIGHHPRETAWKTRPDGAGWHSLSPNPRPSESDHEHDQKQVFERKDSKTMFAGGGFAFQ
jgi:hypothetical protein